MKIRVGTRKSALAMWQTNAAVAAMAAHHPEVEFEVVPISTIGDRDTRSPLSQLGTVGAFTKEIESALLDGRCDLAVHSFKDLGTTQPDGLLADVVLPRERPEDVWVSRDGAPFSAAPSGALVGTSSLRRKATLLSLRPDLRIRVLRGNVQTRLRAVGCAVDGGKEPSGEPLYATVMAYAGLLRLGYDRHVAQVLSPDVFLPAPAQGVVVLEYRADDHRVARVARAVHHRETAACAFAERAFLNAMEGGCQLPVGALAAVRDGAVHLEAAVYSLDGRSCVRDRGVGADPIALGRSVAETMKRNGAQDILDDVHRCLKDHGR